MLDTEKQKLLERDSEYISIGITFGGIAKEIINVPWERTAHAYNMKIPNVYFAPEDLEDESLMALLSNYQVVGCYIWTPFANYDFLLRFPYIRDLNIRCGDAIDNLDFLVGLKDCSMFFLHNAHLQNLDVILDSKLTNQTSIMGGFRCVGLYNCCVADLSRFEREKHCFSEFLIWNKKHKDERQRWKVISASTWRYYEIED